MAIGRVIRFDDIKGYGFIAPSDGGEDVFVHANDLSDRGLRVSAGTQVEFQVIEGDRGLKAYDVRVIGDAPPPGIAMPASLDPAANGHLPVPPALGAVAPADDELLEVLPEREFAQQITELLLTAAPQLTGATILDIRAHLLQFARRNGWVE
jgi:cold shock protein